MLKKQMEKYLESLKSELDKGKLELFPEENEYIEKHRLLPEEYRNIKILEKAPSQRFQDVYIERCNKETEELLSQETNNFMDQSIRYFKANLEEFIYLESKWFEIIGVDAVSLEMDSVFHTYDIMLGLKQPKKADKAIRSFLTKNLYLSLGRFDLLFNSNEGIWDLNFSLNGLNKFDEEWTIREAYLAVYHFLFQLVLTVESEISKK